MGWGSCWGRFGVIGVTKHAYSMPLKSLRSSSQNSTHAVAEGRKNTTLDPGHASVLLCVSSQSPPPRPDDEGSSHRRMVRSWFRARHYQGRRYPCAAIAHQARSADQRQGHGHQCGRYCLVPEHRRWYVTTLLLSPCRVLDAPRSEPPRVIRHHPLAESRVCIPTAN